MQAEARPCSARSWLTSQSTTKHYAQCPTLLAPAAFQTGNDTMGQKEFSIILVPTPSSSSYGDWKDEPQLVCWYLYQVPNSVSIKNEAQQDVIWDGPGSTPSQQLPFMRSDAPNSMLSFQWSKMFVCFKVGPVLNGHSLILQDCGSIHPKHWLENSTLTTGSYWHALRKRNE